jgi:glycosyltransferase involved in cell wall biosynthesis
MNILFLTNHLDPGGITAYLLTLCRALGGSGGVRLFIASRGGAREEVFRSLGVTVWRVPLTTKCEVSPKVFWSHLRLKPLIRQERIDLLHAQTRVTQVLAAGLSRATGVPFLSTCHGYFKPRLSRRLFPCWGRKVIAISDQVRAHLRDDFGLLDEQIALIYNGVDVERFKPPTAQEKQAACRAFGLDPSKKTVGHIGRLSDVKGQKYLVEAAAKICAARQDAQFLLVGDGKEEGALRRLVRDRKLDNVFHFQRSVEDTAVSLRAMDVFVMPSLQEGLGLSLLEAMASGVPCVASMVGGILTVVQDGVTGLLVPPADPAFLARGISRLLDDAALSATLAYQARRQAEKKFDASTMAHRTKEIYASLCKEALS